MSGHEGGPPARARKKSDERDSEHEVKCTFNKCNNASDKYMIQCKDCENYTHYACTRLPPTQLQKFMTKGYKRYSCDNCYEMPVHDDYIKNCFEQKCVLREKELLIEIEELKKKYSRVNDENTRLRDQLKDATEDNKRYLRNIELLEDEAVQSETSVTALREEMRCQKEIFAQAGDPDFDKFMKLEEYMKKGIVDLGKSIQESLVKEIQENNKIIEEKLKQVPSIAGPWNSSTREQSNHPSPSSTIDPVSAVDFRSIIKEQQKQQTDEINDQRSRARNIIIHGVKEVADANKSEAKKFDEDFVRNMQKTMAIEELKIVTINRIGVKNPDRTRPLLITMSNEEDKDILLRNLTKLKDQVVYKGVSVTEDYTVAERKLLTEWRDKAKEKNTEEGDTSKYIWRVRGTPKNGLSLKRFLKQRLSPGQGI